MRAVLAAVLAAASCAQAQTAAGTEEGGCARHEPAFARLIGLDGAEAIAALRAMPGIRSVRAGGPGTPMTCDYRPDRATVLLRDGRAERITCG